MRPNFQTKLFDGQAEKEQKPLKTLTDDLKFDSFEHFSSKHITEHMAQQVHSHESWRTSLLNYFLTYGRESVRQFLTVNC